MLMLCHNSFNRFVSSLFEYWPVKNLRSFLSVSAKTRLVRTSMLQKLRKFLTGQYSKKEDTNRLKHIPSYSPVRGEFENLCFVPLALTVCVSRAFVYDAVNNIVIVSSIKPPSYPYVQVSTGLILYFV